MMNKVLDNKLTIRRILVLLILYILSGSTYITLISSSERIAAAGIILMSPVIVSTMRRNVSGPAFCRGLLAYGFAAFVIGIGMINKDNMVPIFEHH